MTVAGCELGPLLAGAVLPPLYDTVPGAEQLTSTLIVRVTEPAVIVTAMVPDVLVGVVSEAVASPPLVSTVPVIVPNGVAVNETEVPSSTFRPLASRTLTWMFVAL